MYIRRSNSSDYEAIANINRQAFKQENEAQLVESIRNSEFYVPDLELVAEVEGAVVGHILLSYIHLVGRETLKVLALAPMCVQPQFQRQGIGSRLVEASLEAATQRGELMAIVLGHPQFYSRFGFQPSVAYGIESPFPVSERFFMLKLLKNEQEAYAGKVIYPPTFNEV